MPQFASPASRNAPTIHQSFCRSWWRMPSSTAYLERNGGASAVPVAASSEKTERIVRVLYGVVRRARAAIRRRVRRHDQSSTVAPRCIVRCPPGCQTLTRGLLLVRARAHPHPGWGAGSRRPRSRRYQPRARASVPIPRRNVRAASRDLLDFGLGARLDRVRELTFEQAVLVDVPVDLARLE